MSHPSEIMFGMDLAGCGEIGRSQDGLILRHQSMQFLSQNQIQTLRDRQYWTSVRRGVYLGTSTPQSWRQQVRSAVLARKDVAVASHRTAGYLWGFLEITPLKIQLLAPYGKSARTPGVKVFRTRRWDVVEVVHIDGIPVTTPSRTLFNLGGCLGIDSLLTAFDHGITLGLITYESLLHEIDLLGFKTQPCAPLRELLRRRSDDFEKVTEVSEANALAVFKSAGLPEMSSQHRVLAPSGRVAIPDFAYADLKIAIEVMSWRWHGGPNRFEKDMRKRADLRAAGWTVVDLTYRMLKQEPELAVKAIQSALHDAQQQTS